MVNPTLEKLKENFADSILEIVEHRGQLSVSIKKEALLLICKFLKDEAELKYNFLSDVCGVDYPERGKRFDIIYNLYSLPFRWRVRLKVGLAEGEAINSVTSIWKAANWLEREVFDMFGVKFDNHPDLRRILMPDDWEGHPLRKTYPLTTEEIAFSHNKDKLTK
ncbi:MAG: NADH-quinone oxidoreductase subunit C [candidate division Zixibacteria bacterium]|nr:NADH-quinone oxidoreductase subunit C [candidate division Zixibacteria bacterium]